MAIFSCAQHAVGFSFVGAQNTQCAHALAVQAEAFAERCRYEKYSARQPQIFANHSAVFFQCRGQSPGRPCRGRHQFIGLDHLNHLVPLRGGDVVAGWVVAAGVQEGDGASRAALQARPACRQSSPRAWPRRSRR
jgi:hypothetical protein